MALDDLLIVFAAIGFLAGLLAGWTLCLAREAQKGNP